MTSSEKVAFDLSQLQYLKKAGLLSFLFDEQYHAIQSSISNISSFLYTLRDNDRQKAVRLIHTDVYDIAHVLNRAYYIAPETQIPASSIAHLGALNQLRAVSHELVLNDFIVVDVILQTESLQKMARFLLQSTIWFDCTNGRAAVSHHDDGLVDDAFAHLSQQLALSLSVGAAKYKVLKYFALAMPMTGNAESPVFLSNKDELSVVLWMSPLTVDDNENEDDSSDGILIFDEFAAAKLYSDGVSVYPSVHPDFLSKSGDLNIDIMNRCHGSTYELVPRKTNRLVVVKARKPFVFKTAKHAKSRNFHSFTESYMTAVIVILKASSPGA
jgi:hypothetical protein